MMSIAIKLAGSLSDRELFIPIQNEDEHNLGCSLQLGLK